MAKPKEYPEVLVIPAQSTHKQTAIVLHGRGSTAGKFAYPLLNHPVSSRGPEPDSDTSFQSHLPNTQFIFPTASLRRAAAYNRSLTHQWFDLYPLDTYAPEHKQDIQLQGLKESVRFIHGLLEDAVKGVGAENVVLMGLSQGCAVSLVALILWEGDALGGFVGMCGWLPFRKSMLEDLVGDSQEVDGDEDYFEQAEGEKGIGEEKTKLGRVIAWLREELDLSPEKIGKRTVGAAPISRTPMFLGHGENDEKVPCKLGDLATRFFTEVGVEVRWSKYHTLGHWYSEDMLRDVVGFIKGPKNWRT